MAATYRVVIQGVTPGKDFAEVASALSQAFKLPAEKLAPVLQLPRFIIRRGLTLADAARYEQVLQQAGAVCVAEPDVDETPLVVDIPATLAPGKKKFATYEDLTPELREKLKPHRTHTNMTCLECGYSGLMGVTGTSVPWWLSLWLLIPLFMIIGGAFGLVGFIVSIVLALVFSAMRQQHLKKQAICPSCDKRLTSTETV